MSRVISKFLLKLLGWRIDEELFLTEKKAVAIMAPHTSNWDFFLAKMAFDVVGLKVGFLIKKEAFFFPFAGWLKREGGIPVDRRKKTDLVNQIVERMDSEEEFIIAITPEGTRSPVKYWKKGFYSIAVKANLPIFIGYIDYKRKVGGIAKVMYPTGNMQKDFEEIVAFYKTITPRHPEKYIKAPKLR
ncbi:MAG: 1-acyl-sn-glycerol-3-phosphate acyltransferase [Bacteroidota bacterium]|nr:1-acyl-sn-glycerol-3-phosphate acyltransferase [Bacteroidota bacterium]